MHDVRYIFSYHRLTFAPWLQICVQKSAVSFAVRMQQGMREGQVDLKKHKNNFIDPLLEIRVALSG